MVSQRHPPLTECMVPFKFVSVRAFSCVRAREKAMYSEMYTQADVETSKTEQGKVKQAACRITHHLSRILSQPLGHEMPIAGVLYAPHHVIV